jgi:hypothetical protein
MLDTLSEGILVMTVLEFTTVSDLGNLACCSTYMRIVADNQGLWRRRYVDSRKTHFRIGPNSLHQPYRNIWACRFTCTFSRTHRNEQWAAAGYPCTNLHHFEHGTLLEVGKRATNYRNFKRAYAKTAKSKLRFHTLATNQKLHRAQQQIHLARHQLAGAKARLDRVEKLNVEAKARLVQLEDLNAGRCQPGAHRKFDAILALPPSTPPHLRKKPRNTKK